MLDVKEISGTYGMPHVKTSLEILSFHGDQWRMACTEGLGLQQLANRSPEPPTVEGLGRRFHMTARQGRWKGSWVGRGSNTFEQTNFLEILFRTTILKGGCDT